MCCCVYLTSRVDTSSVGSLKQGTQLGAFGPIGSRSRPALPNMNNQNRLRLPMPEGMFTFYPAMTAFTDQYILPNNFLDVGQL